MWPGFNDVATTYPHLHQQVNTDIHPADVLTRISSGSGRRIGWRCEQGHTWSARVVDRVHSSTGCPDCRAEDWASRGENQVAEYIEGLLGITIRRGVYLRHENQKFNFDLCVPELKVLIEYNGLFYHCEATGRDERYHGDKLRVAHANGYQLLTVWEDDWNERRSVVERMLAHKLGVSQELRTPARLATIVPLSSSRAAAFLEVNHIQGAATGSVRLGLEAAGDLVAVLVARYEGPFVTICRYATSRIVPGGFGRLLKTLERHVATSRPDITVVKTFSDNLISDGELYDRLGFVHDRDVRPDYMCYRGRGRRQHKFAYRISRFKANPDLRYEEGLSERELAELNKVHRIWDAGKKRWVKQIRATHP